MKEKFSRHIDLYYPRLAKDPYPAHHTDVVDTIYISLMDVRAARDIRIQYDFDRDGYVVSAQTWDSDADGPWNEVALVPADDRGEE